MTKEDLREYQWILNNVEYLEADILRLRDMVDVKSQVISDEPKGGQLVDKTASAVAAIVDTQQTLMDRVTDLMAKRREIETAIESLPEKEKAIIRLRYIEGKAWERICADMSYSWREVHRCHSKAIRDINTFVT